MIHCGCPEDLKYKLCAEGANRTTVLDNILVVNSDDLNAYEKYYGREPTFLPKLRTFGEVGVVLDRQKMKNKLASRGYNSIFVGYAQQHAVGVYRMYNIDTRRISLTRDVRWTNTMIGDLTKRELTMAQGESSGRENNDDDINDDPPSPDTTDEDNPEQDDITQTGREDDPDEQQEDTISEASHHSDARELPDPPEPVNDDNNEQNDSDNDPDGLNAKTRRELAKLHTSYNPTLDDVVEIALVGGTDDSYSNPNLFDDAWDHEEAEDRAKWREGIRKELRDMIKRKVCERTKIANVPQDRRLIGCKWLFKKKRNEVYRARLVALGYSQVADIDFTDNYSPVVQDQTFRILCVLILYNNWTAEIVDIKTAFLYGELEEVIYMKLPEGYEVVTGGKTEKDECVRLTKTIYGLVKAARQYFKTFSATLTKMGFEKCMADQCLFSRKSSDRVVIIAVYIDDTLCIGDKKAFDKFKQEIKKRFVTKEEGNMTEYVGCEVVRKKRDELVMKQSHLIGRVKKQFGELTSTLKGKQSL